MPHPRGVDWTEAEDVRLGDLWMRGFSASQIARMLFDEGFTQRSRNSVIGRRLRIGLPARAFSPKESANCRYRGKEHKKQREWRRTAPASKESLRHKPVNVTAEPASPLHTPLLALEFGQCRAVADASDWGRPTYCGHPVTHEGASYCGGCSDRFYDRKPKPRQRASEDERARRARYRDSARWAAL